MDYTDNVVYRIVVWAEMIINGAKDVANFMFRPIINNYPFLDSKPAHILIGSLSGGLGNFIYDLFKLSPLELISIAGLTAFLMIAIIKWILA